MRNETQKLGFIIVALTLALPAIYFAAIASAPRTAMVLMTFSILSFIAAMYEPSKQTLVEFDSDGLYDSRLGVGKIYWKEVKDFYIADGEGNRFLCLKVLRPERFLMNADRSLRRRLEFNQSLGFRHINVDVRHLNMSVQHLHSRIERRIEAAIGSGEFR